ncbi:hypothetical protein KI387_018384, partial [Taxus chinensis]
EVMFGVVTEGMVDVMGATGVRDMTVIAGIGPNYETTGGKVEVGSTELDGAEVEVGVRVGGIDTGMPYIN